MLNNIEDKDYTYDAFISYRHTNLDKAIASKLQKLLENYKPPASVTGKGKAKRMRIFRDEAELPTSNNLSENIQDALKNSRFLVVLCSKTTKASKWCMQEITTFKELHDGKTDRILTILTEGEPSEVFPAELCTEERIFTDANGNKHKETVEIEPLAANVTAPTVKKSLKKLKREFLRIAAQLCGCSFDALYNRHQRRYIRRIIIIASSIVAFLIAFGIYSSAMIIEITGQRDLITEQRDEIDIRRTEAEENYNLANENLNYAKSLLLSIAIDYAYELSSHGARNRAAAVLLKVYEYIEKSGTDNTMADMLYSKFRDTAIDVMYYNDETQPFAKLDLREKILDIDIMEERDIVIITTAPTLYCVDINTGNIINTYHSPGFLQSDDSLTVHAFFSTSSFYSHYIFAATENGHVMTVNTQTGETSLTSDGVTRQYYRDDIVSVAYNDEIQAITMISHNNWEVVLTVLPYDTDTMSVLDTRQDLSYTVIPRTVSALGGNDDNEEEFIYNNEGIYAYSPNNRFMALRLNDVGSAEVISNGEIVLIDFNKFDSKLSAEQNKAAMPEVVDCRFDGGDIFYISKFFVGDTGILTIEGYVDDENDSFYAISNQRIIVYDVVEDRLLFNDRLSSDTSQYGSSIIRPMNRFDFYLLVHHLASDTETLPVSVWDPDYDKKVGDFRRKNPELTIDQFIAMPITSDYHIAYQNRYNGKNYMEIRRIDGSSLHFEFPNNTVAVKSFYFYDVDTYSGETYSGFITVEQYGGGIRNYILKVNGNEATTETVDVLLSTSMSAVEIDLQRGIMLHGHEDGTVLMYNRGATPVMGASNTDMYEESNMSAGSGREMTGIEADINADWFGPGVIAFNEDRSKIFGYLYREHSIYGMEKIYYIFNTFTGELENYYSSWPFVNDCELFHARINSDFTYVVTVDETNFGNFGYVYRVYDVEKGEIFEILKTFNLVQGTQEDGSGDLRNQIFFGIGDNPDILWFFFEKTLRMMVVNIKSGETIDEWTVRERISADKDNPPATPDDIITLRDVVFNLDGDCIIFLGGTYASDGVYSLSADRMIYRGKITFVESDCSALYINENYERVPLTPAEVYNVLERFAYTGVMTDADIAATGLDIFE